MGADLEFAQRRERLISELGPPPSAFDDGDAELASEELSVAASAAEAPGPLP